jgi:hypothetical protein
MDNVQLNPNKVFHSEEECHANSCSPRKDENCYIQEREGCSSLELTKGLIEAITNKDGFKAYQEILGLLEKQEGISFLENLVADESLALIKCATDSGMEQIARFLGLFVKKDYCNKRASLELQGLHSAFSIEKKVRAEFASLTLSDVQSAQETRFLDTVKELLSTDEGIQTLIYTYPLFTNEKRLFGNLLVCEKKRVYKFLCELVLHAFPNGIEEMVAAAEVLEQLAGALKIDLPRALECGVLQSLLPQKKSLPKTVLPLKMVQSKEVLNSFWKEEQIGRRDACLVQQTGLKGLREWLEKGKEVPKMLEIFSCTTKSIAFQIVSELDHEVRLSVILKFVRIADKLLKTGNFNGAMQISKALSMDAIFPLWREKTLGLGGETSQDCRNFALLSNSTSNYGCYREKMKEFLKTAGRDAKYCLPAVSILCDDLQLIYKGLVDSTGKKLSKKDLQALAGNIQLLMNFQNVKQAGSDPYLSFWLGLEEISEGVLGEYRFLCQSGERRSFIGNIPQELSAWCASDLMRCLLEETDDTKIAKNLFAQGVFDGKALIEKLDQDVHFMDAWEPELRDRLMQLHLEHLQSNLHARIKPYIHIDYV